MGSSHIKQQDWYLVATAAKWLNTDAVKLNDLEEPDRTYWINRGLMGHNAEIEAREESRQWED